jgi:hypothetical protein
MHHGCNSSNAPSSSLLDPKQGAFGRYSWPSKGKLEIADYKLTLLELQKRQPCLISVSNDRQDYYTTFIIFSKIYRTFHGEL